MIGLGGGRWRIAVIDHATMHRPARPRSPSYGRARCAWLDRLRHAGDRGAWLSRVGNETRQVSAYRRGRVDAGRRCRAHPLPGRRPGPEPRPAGRIQPRLEANRRNSAAGHHPGCSTATKRNERRSGLTSSRTLWPSAACSPVPAGKAWRCATGSTASSARTRRCAARWQPGCPAWRLPTRPTLPNRPSRPNRPPARTGRRSPGSAASECRT